MTEHADYQQNLITNENRPKLGNFSAAPRTSATDRKIEETLLSHDSPSRLLF